MPSTPTDDRLVKGRAWARIRDYWIRRREPCARCGGWIDYDNPTRTWRSLDVGHIVERDAARTMGWTDAQINDIANTQPEHQRCSRVAGASYGNAKRGAVVRRRPVEADEW